MPITWKSDAGASRVLVQQWGNKSVIADVADNKAPKPGQPADTNKNAGAIDFVTTPKPGDPRVYLVTTWRGSQWEKLKKVFNADGSQASSTVVAKSPVTPVTVAKPQTVTSIISKFESLKTTLTYAAADWEAAFPASANATGIAYNAEKMKTVVAKIGAGIKLIGELALEFQKFNGTKAQLDAILLNDTLKLSSSGLMDAAVGKFSEYLNSATNTMGVYSKSISASVKLANSAAEKARLMAGLGLFTSVLSGLGSIGALAKNIKEMKPVEGFNNSTKLGPLAVNSVAYGDQLISKADGSISTTETSAGGLKQQLAGLSFTYPTLWQNSWDFLNAATSAEGKVARALPGLQVREVLVPPEELPAGWKVGYNSTPNDPEFMGYDVGSRYRGESNETVHNTTHFRRWIGL